MKKVLLLLGVIVLFGGACHASNLVDFKCGSNPYSESFSYSNLLGTNFISEKIANAVLKKAILKDSKGKYKVNLQSYNVTSLKKGIFKSLEIEGTDTVTDDIYASNVKFKTLCDYNYIETDNKNKTTTFKEPFGMTFVIGFSANDLNKTMQGKKYSEIIRKANNIGNSSKLFNITGSSAKISENKLYYTMEIKMPLLNKKQKLTIETSVKARSGEIMLCDTNLVTESFSVDISKLDRIINYLNPLQFSMELFENKGADVNIQDVTIKNNIINVSGFVTVEKDVVTEQ